MPVSKLDTAYRSLVISKFFKKGWGKPENLKKLFEFRKIVSKRETCFPLVDTNYPVTITKKTNYGDIILLEGEFPSPFEKYLPGLLPEISQPAYFQVLVPKKWQSSHYKPICLHLAGTGDHFFFRRRNLMAKPLIKDAGIGAILLENPFYGFRKPKDQRWSALHNVSDIFVMGGCLILETLVLFHWCKRNGFGPFGLTGISMGGHMASLAATNIPEPVVLVPCLSWTTASGVFTRGVLSSAIDWEFLEEQYFRDGSYSNEIKHMVKIIDDVYVISRTSSSEIWKKLSLNFVSGPATPSSLKSVEKQNTLYAAGQHFAKNYPESLIHVQKLTSNIFQNIGIKNSKISKAKDVQVSENYGTDIGQKNTENKDEDISKLLMQINKKEENESKLEKAKTKMSNYLKFNKKNGRDGLMQESGDNLKSEKNDAKLDREKQEALQFMCGIMDECTHLKNFSVPVDTELIISVTAVADGYVPRDGLTDLQELWRGSEVRYLNAGHISAYLLHQKFFRLAIIDAFEKLKLKYYNDESTARCQ